MKQYHIEVNAESLEDVKKVLKDLEDPECCYSEIYVLGEFIGSIHKYEDYDKLVDQKQEYDMTFQSRVQAGFNLKRCHEDALEAARTFHKRKITEEDMNTATG